MTVILALLIGIVAGLRAMIAPAAVSWAAYLGWLQLDGTWVAFLGYTWTPWVFTVLALGELVTDQLPSTPSRKVPVQFAGRVLSGALCGAAIGAPGGALLIGLCAGILGAVLGTFAGALGRGMLARLFGGDWPAAVIEDVVAIVSAYAIVSAAAA